MKKVNAKEQRGNSRKSKILKNVEKVNEWRRINKDEWEKKEWRRMWVKGIG